MPIEKFRKTEIRVPVQYGNLSYHPRLCYSLGNEKKPVDGVEHSYNYYKICNGQKSGGRYFVEEIYWDKESRYTRFYYIRFSELPVSIQIEIKSRYRCPCGKVATHICKCGILCCGEDPCIEGCGGYVIPLKQGLKEGIKPREPE